MFKSRKKISKKFIFLEKKEQLPLFFLNLKTLLKQIFNPEVSNRAKIVKKINFSNTYFLLNEEKITFLDFLK